MNDQFLRQSLNQLTGLTMYDQVVGASTPVLAGQWTTLDLGSLDNPLKEHTIITAFKLDTNVTDARMRMTVGGNKIFPHKDSSEVSSGVSKFLQFKIQIPKNNSFALEVYSDTGGVAEVSYLSIIKVAQYSHS